MGMARLNVQMKVNVSRTKILEMLKKNRANHAYIVEEAEKGYLAAALAAVARCDKDLKAGKVVNLSDYALRLPVDYRSAYDTVIAMLELSEDETIALAADEFRQFIQDEWDWKDGFVKQNAAYSSTARGM